MNSSDLSQITVRDAQEADVPALTAIKQSEVLHRDCLREAQGSGFRYLILLRGEEIIGFAWLVVRRPAHWSDASDTRYLPAIVNLHVTQSQRGKGYGSALIHAMESEAAKAGCQRLYLAVEPLDNPRAFALYQRLGYQPLQPEPYLKVWEFTDSGGELHHGEDWIVDMVKAL